MTGGQAAASYLERLAGRARQVRTTLCVGIDPDPARLPPGFPRDVRGVERLALTLVDAAAAHAVAVKVNLAFFEALGPEGMAALERVRAAVPRDVLFLADAKRGDIGTTSDRHAAAIFDRLDADAVTVSPYTGREGIAPLLERPDRFCYVLCRTSNPGAGEFQDLLVAADSPGDGGSAAAEPLYVRVARRVSQWAAGGAQCGLVVGATAPPEMGRVREVAPELPFLVPGIGRQGGDLKAVKAQGPVISGNVARNPGGGLLVNVSRGISDAAPGSADPRSALAEATALWAAELRV